MADGISKQQKIYSDHADTIGVGRRARMYTNGVR